MEDLVSSRETPKDMRTAMTLANLISSIPGLPFNYRPCDTIAAENVNVVGQRTMCVRRGFEFMDFCDHQTQKNQKSKDMRAIPSYTSVRSNNV